MYPHPLSSVKESLSQALNNRIVPNQEYLLQGSIIDSAVDHLMHRLKGLCDNVDTAPETFHDMETCYVMMMPNQQPPISLRVRRALDRDVPFQLRYIGNPEIDRNRPALLRSSIDVGITATITEFLQELGFRIDFEYTSRGYLFRKGRMKITVAKIMKMGPGKQYEAYNETISQSYIVELSVLAPSGYEGIAEEMRLFAEQLKPLVQLDKIDYKRYLL